MPVHIGHWMQFNVARITILENENTAAITLDKPIAYRKGNIAAANLPRRRQPQSNGHN